MFVVAGGTPRASGSGVAMAGVTACLIINVSTAIEELMGTAKKPGTHLAHTVPR